MKKKGLGKLLKSFTAIAIAAAVTFTGIPVAPVEAATQYVPSNAVSANSLKGEIVNEVKSASQGVYVYAVASSGVWVHSSKSLASSTRLYSLPQNQALPVIRTEDDGTWIDVQLDATYGYATGYIYNEEDLVIMRTSTSETDGWVGLSNTEAVVTTKGGLNVHSVAGVQFQSLGTLPYGASVPARAYSDNWVQIQYKNNRNVYVEGFVSRAFVKLVGPNQSSNLPNPAPNNQPAEQPADKATLLHSYNAMALTSGHALNVHVSPSIQSKVFTTLANGYMATAVSRTKNWVAIEFYYEGAKVTGYVYRSYTKLVRNTGSTRLTKRNFSIKKGKKNTYEYLAGVRRNYMTKVKWSSSNKSVATISKNGRINAKKKGTTTITCKYVKGGKTRTLKTKLTVK